MTIEDMIDDFLENDATTEEDWLRKETYKRMKLLRMVFTIFLLLVLCLILIICDALFFKSIIVSVITGIASILGIIIKIFVTIKSY